MVSHRRTFILMVVDGKRWWNNSVGGIIPCRKKKSIFDRVESNVRLEGHDLLWILTPTILYYIGMKMLLTRHCL